MDNQVRCFCGGTLWPDGYEAGSNHREDYTAKQWQCDVCGRQVDGLKIYELRHKPTKDVRYQLAHASR